MRRFIIVIVMLISTAAFTQEISEAKLKVFASKIEMKTTTPEEPVSMNAKIFPSLEGCDVQAYLAVKVKVHENWHIYAYVPEGGFFIQSEMKLDLPEGFTANLVKEPKTIGYEADPQIMLYKGDLLFVYELSGNNVAVGEYSVESTLSYQPCDPYACLPPNEMKVKNQLIMDK